jgi:serine/threonine protein kinase
MMVMDSKQGKREGSHGMKTQPKYKHSKMES